MGIVISTNEPEEVWNAFRFGTTALNANHEVSVFLLNRGVEIEEIRSEKYKVDEQVASFLGNKGKILACGTCLKSRQKEGSGVCPISTMRDLLKLVEESDRILTFG
ncbi:sulfur reduction protein DsrE [Candidatus Micrarchaeota archaeon CG1_02_47_40]|nr:MAG: sulfur reduction protein DsrE [Candidatus Micrarchaeota archaeon CG1_02_47_40]